MNTMRPTNRLEHLLAQHGQPAPADNPFDTRPDTRPDAVRDAIAHDVVNAHAVGIAIAADQCDIACDGARAVAALCASEVKRLDALIENLHHPHAYITPDTYDHPNKQLAAHLAYMRDTYEQTRQSLLDTCDEVYQLARVVAPLREEDEGFTDDTEKDASVPALSDEWQLGRVIVANTRGMTTDAFVPTLPEGWRLANHEEHGRVIVTRPEPDEDGYVCYGLPINNTLGYEWRFCTPNELTYLD